MAPSGYIYMFLNCDHCLLFRVSSFANPVQRTTLSYLLGPQTMAPVIRLYVLLLPSLRSSFSSSAFASTSVSFCVRLSLLSLWVISPFASALSSVFLSFSLPFSGCSQRTPPLRSVWVLLRGVGGSIASFLLFRIAASSTTFFLAVWDELCHHPPTILWSAYTTIQGGLV